MNAFLVQLALSNLLLSAGLAVMAYLVHRHGRYPVLAHLLWVLVLAKLVTPPLLSLPLATFPVSSVVAGQPALAPGATISPDLGAAVFNERGVTFLLLAWALGSAVVLVVSLLRIYRFDRLLRRTSSRAPAHIQWLAQDVAGQLGLRSRPTIHVSTARLSPMTWWAGGDVRVVIPEALPDEIDTEQLRWVLGHELAHVKRRDHFVRWLEWLACVSFWWNPIAWWARTNLRFDEEASCDALVLDRLGPRPRSYAAALLAVVELMSRPALRPPVVATGIDGGGSLERRFRLIISGQHARRVPRWLISGVVVSSLVLMPLGVGQATDDESARTAAVVGLELGSSQVVGLDPGSSQVVGFSRAAQGLPSPVARSSDTAAPGAAAGDAAGTPVSAKLSRDRTVEITPASKSKNAKARSAKKQAAKKRAARKAADRAPAAAVTSAGWVDTATVTVPSDRIGPSTAERHLSRPLRS